ncbi:hypothetical protein BGZ52_010356, partial [Haplosporangium bisporale]
MTVLPDATFVPTSDPITPPATPVINDAGSQDHLTVSARHLKHHPLVPEFVKEYTMGDELGSGGFGFVVSATRNSDQREVAV